MDEFLPKEYEVPKSPSNYMKFEEGENSFRVLSSAIIGYEYFTKESKPVRNKIGWTDTPEDIKKRDDGSFAIKHFWAFVVWNNTLKKIQILQITQKTIQTAIKSLVNNKKWGDPKTYDICVTRTGEGLDTEYSVVPEPKEKLDDSILQSYEDKNINLEALYEGKDPFDTKVA